MDTLKIKTILSAVENKSLSKTAEELSYTPSALSHMADSLEKELGVKLLKRTPKGVELTEQGEKLKDKMQAVLDAEEMLKRSALALNQDNEQTLRIGAFFSVSFNLLPQILKKFKNKYPDISISISVQDSFSAWLKNDLADIVFSDIPEHDGAEFIPFMRDKYLAVLPQNVLKNKKTVSREDLYNYTFISVNDNKTKEFIDESRFKKILKFSSTDDLGALTLVKQGIGVAILPSLSLQENFSGIHTAMIEPAHERVLGFSYSKQNKKYCLQKFVKFLKEYYNDEK